MNAWLLMQQHANNWMGPSCSARKIISTQGRIKTTASNWDYTPARPSSAFVNEPSMPRNHVSVCVNSMFNILSVNQRVKLLVSIDVAPRDEQFLSWLPADVCFSPVFTTFLQPSAESGWRGSGAAKNLQFTTRTCCFSICKNQHCIKCKWTCCLLKKIQGYEIVSPKQEPSLLLIKHLLKWMIVNTINCQQRFSSWP